MSRMFAKCSMPKRKPQKSRLDQYEAMKAASGWYLAAWRDFRGLTLEELAEGASTSRGQVQGLETGTPKAGTDKPVRYNRDWLERFGKVLNVAPGHLIEVNPFSVRADIIDAFAQVPEEDRERALQLIQSFRRA